MFDYDPIVKSLKRSIDAINKRLLETGPFLDTYEVRELVQRRDDLEQVLVRREDKLRKMCWWNRPYIGRAHV